jgi:ribulose kinase
MSIHPQPPLVIGVDFGTLSGRAVVVRVADGAELGSAITEYPHAVVDRQLPGSGRTEFLLIGSQSTPGAFADRLRWNQACYRLAQGLSGSG